MKIVEILYYNPETRNYTRLSYQGSDIYIEMWKSQTNGTKFFYTKDELVAKTTAETWCDLDKFLQENK